MGMSADYTQILVDGLPLVGRVAGVIDISRIATGNIEQIEIVKGPMSSLYGSDALAGVINLRTRRPSDGWSARMQAQALSIQGVQSNLSVGYSAENTEWTMFLDLRSSPAFEQKWNSLSVPYAGFRDGTIQSKLRTKLSAEWDAEATARVFISSSSGKFVESFYTQVAANTGSVSQSDLNAALSANYRKGNLHVLAQLYATRFNERYNFDVSQGDAGKTDDYERSLIRPFVQANLLLSDRIRCTLGSEIAFDAISGSRYPGRPSFTTSVLYGQWEGNPLDNLSYSLSARYDANSEFGDNLNPKLAVMYEAYPNVRLRASMGTGFKAPDFRQLYVVFRNNLQGAGYLLTGARLLGQDLKAEQSVSADVSLSADQVLGALEDGTPQIALHADLRAYQNHIAQMIEFYLFRIDGQTSVYSYRNVARVRTRGIECSVKLDYAMTNADTVLVAAGYQYLRAEDLDVLDAITQRRAGTIDRTTGSFIPLTSSAYGGLWFRSPHMANVRAEFISHLGLSLSARADYTGSFADEALDKNGSVLGSIVRTVPDRPDEYVAGYWNLKLNALYTLPAAARWLGVSSLRVGLGATNILDVRNLQSMPSLIGRQLSGQVVVVL
jgi:outer membrane receptor for ferrienterochelin and colicins